MAQSGINIGALQAVTLGDGSTCSVDDVVSGTAVALPGGMARYCASCG